MTSRGVNRAVMEQLVKLYKESHLGKRLPAYDGRKSLYTAGPLPFVLKEFKITLVDEDDGSGGPRFLFLKCLLVYSFPLITSHSYARTPLFVYLICIMFSLLI